MTYLMMPLELVFVVEIAASADQSYSVIEARDLMFEAFVAYLVAVNFAAVANFAAATVQAVIESVRSIAAVVVVVPTADPGNQNFNFLQLNQQDPKPVAVGDGNRELGLLLEKRWLPLKTRPRALERRRRTAG
ncbi:hypothetical protein U1Q18_001027, partial [Sarracenia purpurea var. burkii]